VALEREREKRTRVVEIAGIDQAKQLGKSERKIAREWAVITTALQKQLGAEQMRVVQLQKLGTRSARVYELGLAEVEKKLGQAQEERQVAQDEYKVGNFLPWSPIPLFMICFLFGGFTLFTRWP